MDLHPKSENWKIWRLRGFIWAHSIEKSIFAQSIDFWLILIDFSALFTIWILILCFGAVSFSNQFVFDFSIFSRTWFIGYQKIYQKINSLIPIYKLKIDQLNKIGIANLWNQRALKYCLRILRIFWNLWNYKKIRFRETILSLRILFLEKSGHLSPTYFFNF